MAERRGELVVRVDANREIGAGHLMRCLALGEAWSDEGGRVTFVTSCTSKALLRRLHEEGADVVEVDQSWPAPQDWATTRDVLSGLSGGWVVVDGYHFDEEYQALIKETGRPLLVIDDMAHLRQYVADVILNQNLHAPSLHYNCVLPSQMLLGSPYVLLRREFRSRGLLPREIAEDAGKVLVTLGGADPRNVTSKVVEGLSQVQKDRLEVRVIVGPANPRVAELREVASTTEIVVELEEDVGDMTGLMAWADLAVSGGGVTCWELAFMGLPSLVLPWSDNQRPIAEGLHDAGVAWNLGWHADVSNGEIGRAATELLNDLERRRQMAVRGQELVDGEGVGRVVNNLLLREAT